ncbi:hypothetical protein BDD43_3600 [Mucilaginibacter gracilis]|uniref:Uncharacterized protein n=1 Tax=Mucilaginibacter gracilis TaxID=423350 RepID=A0A495J472_9SPHI|nr:hypothetical protein [Mucilaginibacter gracilis]RKR83392.1 hypothetical protein BDD43_3600 [Mucilaginibacter gracilis]
MNTDLILTGLFKTLNKPNNRGEKKHYFKLYDMHKIKYIVFLFPILLSACKKEQLLNPEKGTSPVNFNIRGAVLTTDTLELIFNNKVLGTIPAGKVPFTGGLFTPGDKIQLRKKADGKIIKEFEVAEKPFNQVKNFFYDGATLSDNIVLTPVSNPDNMGFRFRFSTTFKDFYGGPVDLEFLDVDDNTYEIVPYIKVKNITGTFGDFIEFAPLKPDHSYYLLVYKAGTEDLPYTSLENVSDDAQSNPYQRFLTFTDFKKGDSQLLSISPYLSEKNKVLQGYDMSDLSAIFK